MQIETMVRVTKQNTTTDTLVTHLSFVTFQVCWDGSREWLVYKCYEGEYNASGSLSPKYGTEFREEEVAGFTGEEGGS